MVAVCVALRVLTPRGVQGRRVRARQAPLRQRENAVTVLRGHEGVRVGPPLGSPPRRPRQGRPPRRRLGPTLAHAARRRVGAGRSPRSDGLCGSEGLPPGGPQTPAGPGAVRLPVPPPLLSSAEGSLCP